jgi:hypothetical protein
MQSSTTETLQIAEGAGVAPFRGITAYDTPFYLKQYSFPESLPITSRPAARAGEA